MTENLELTKLGDMNVQINYARTYTCKDPKGTNGFTYKTGQRHRLIPTTASVTFEEKIKYTWSAEQPSDLFRSWRLAAGQIWLGSLWSLPRLGSILHQEHLHKEAVSSKLIPSEEWTPAQLLCFPCWTDVKIRIGLAWPSFSTRQPYWAFTCVFSLGASLADISDIQPTIQRIT